MLRAAMLFTLCSSAPAFAQDILVAHAVPDLNFQVDVLNKLTASGAFTSVTEWDLNLATPTAMDLLSFDAVLVYTDTTPLDPVALGDALADALDMGGAVVQGHFSFDTTWGIQGRFLSGGYGPISGTFTTSGSAQLVPVDPTSPLLANVSSFDGGIASYRAGDATLSPGAALVATWTDGLPLVAWQNLGGGTSVGLNFYPPSSDARNDFWTAGTDGDTLLVNALLFAATGTVPGFRAVASGTCPGPASVMVFGGTPNANVAYVTGVTPGATVVPSGVCAGTVIPLGSARLRATGQLDGFGRRTVPANLNANFCGVPFVVVDLANCAVTPVSLLP